MSAVLPEPTDERLRAQGLVGPKATSVVEVVDRLLAVQAQDPRGFRLAIRARSSGLTAADVEQALTIDRSVVVSWLNRGTLHLVRAEDYAWLHALTTPPLRTANSTRLAQGGVSPDAADRGVAVIEQALSADGPLLRRQLRERVAAAGVRVEGQALVHILFLADLRGLIVRGPVVDGEQAFVLVRDWLGDLAPPHASIDRDTALAQLAARYLAGHGPASDRDLAKWAGLPVGSVRRGLAALGSRVEDRGGGLLGPAGRSSGDVEREPRAAAPALLLGAFDPLLLGWVDRSAVLAGHTGLVTSNGIFRPFALVGGQAVGTWGMPGGQVVLTPFASLTPDVEAALAEEAVDVSRFLGVPSPVAAAAD